VQAEDGLDRLVAQRLADREGGQRQARVEGSALGALERDLQRGPARRRLGAEQLVERGIQEPGQLLQLDQLELPLAVLDDGHLRGCAVQGGRQIIQGHAARGAQLPDAAADREGVEHLFILEGIDGLRVHRPRVPRVLLRRNRRIRIFLAADPVKTGCARRRVDA
jgi:hypothetical protein